MEIPAYRVSGLILAFSLLTPVPRALAQQTPPVQITSFSVGPDQTLTYPDTSGGLIPIPSAFVVKRASGDYYLYVAHVYFSSSGPRARAARAQLGANPPRFLKWYNGSFSHPGIGGLDSAAPQPTACNVRCL